MQSNFISYNNWPQIDRKGRERNNNSHWDLLLLLLYENAMALSFLQCYQMTMAVAGMWRIIGSLTLPSSFPHLLYNTYTCLYLVSKKYTHTHTHTHTHAHTYSTSFSRTSLAHLYIQISKRIGISYIAL